MFLITFWAWLLLLLPVLSQDSCRGDTSVYNQNGLIVSFKNLCGKDIQKAVDFPDPTDERTWSDCLDRCVMKAPLCYGFDFTPQGTTAFSCWLMNATFSESDAKTQTSYTVDAAMLDSDFLASLSNDCKTLGLQGCFQKNGQLGTTMTTVRATSTVEPSLLNSATVATAAITTNSGGEASTVILTVVETVRTAGSTSTTSPAPRASGLSIGAKAGIGAGIGAVVMIILLVVTICVLKRMKHRRESTNPAAHLSANEKIADGDPVAELQADNLSPYESSELPGYVPPKTASVFTAQKQMHEIDGSARYEK